MASTKKQTDFQKAEQRFNKISNIRINPSTGKYTVDGKSLTTAEYRKVLNDARKQRDDAKRVLDQEQAKAQAESKRVSEAQKKNQKQVDDLKRERQRLSNQIENYSEDIRRGITADISGKDIPLDRKQALIDQQALRIREIDIALGVLDPTRRDTQPKTKRQIEQEEMAAMPQQAQPAATTTTQRKVTSSTKGKGGKERVTIDGKKVTVGSEQWKTIIQEEFGGLWDVYNENADVKTVIDKSVKEGWFNDENKLTAALQATNWYRTTEQSARQYAIQLSSDPATMEDRITTAVDDLRAGTLANGLTVDDATLRKIATNQIKFGWSEQQTRNAIGSEVVALAQAGGAQGMTDLRQGNVARGLRETARKYAQKPADADLDTWVADIMTGRKTEVQWEDFMRNSAKTQFRSLTPALDRGETVEDATYAYRQQAVQTLQGTVDPSQIDWTSDKWNKALNFQDPKTNEYRQMDLWEWNKYLRTLPEWQETDDAKQAYRNVAYSLAQGFGRMA
jgi:hypothetical protein